MSDTNLFWAVRGTYDERKARLAGCERAWLEAAILDTEYNAFLRDRADTPEGEKDARGRGKRIPYIGWFYRHMEFSEGTLPLGDCGSFIGFMANNKWDYPQRNTTPEEFAAIMAIIDEAMRLNAQGGDLMEIHKATNAKLDELWAYLQTLTVPHTGDVTP